jgi:hypothetical protein
LHAANGFGSGLNIHYQKQKIAQPCHWLYLPNLVIHRLNINIVSSLVTFYTSKAWRESMASGCAHRYLFTPSTPIFICYFPLWHGAMRFQSGSDVILSYLLFN